MSRMLAARLKRQKAMIERLKEDNSRIQHELFLVTEQLSRPAYHAQDTKNTDSLEKLQMQYDKILASTAEDQQQLTQLKQKLSETKAEYSEKKKQRGPDYNKKTTEEVQRTATKRHEEKLDFTRNRFNQIAANLDPLKSTIVTLRKERTAFYKDYAKVIRDLELKKRSIASLTEICSHAYQVREEAHVKMLKIREKLEEEGVRWESEMRELSKAIEHDSRMRDYMKIKEKERDPYKQPAKTNQQILVEQVNSYEEGFDKIQRATGVKDPDEFVQKFINVEEQNYALFALISDLNNEIERNKEQISELRSDIKRYEGQAGNSDHQRQRIRVELESKMSMCELKAAQYVDLHLAVMRTIHNLKNSVISLFQRIGCDVPSNSNLLGLSGVNDTNIMQYLGIIEQRSREITQQYVTKCSSDAAKNALIQGPRVPAGIAIIPVHIPTTIDV